MRAEFFIPVRKYDCEYAVSDSGSVKSLARKVPDGRGRIKSIPQRILRPLLDKNGYSTVILCKHKKRKQVKIHRLVLISFSANNQRDLHVDHIDSDPSNNNLSNLRWATVSQNSMNSCSRAGSASKYKGVSRAGSRWRANIRLNGKQVHLGVFESERAAAMAYDAAAISGFKEFARPNFPETQ
jgi:hypothetical protein